MAFDTSSPPAPSNCPFCAISNTYAPLQPIEACAAPQTLHSASGSMRGTASHSSTTASSPFDSELLSPNAHLVLSTPLVMAFLDIMPLSPGHLLVTTRQHHEKISDISEEESRELGFWLPVLSRVLADVQGVWDWNIVQNNGAAAAQVVPHVHYHIIPRPALTPELRNRSFTMFGRGQRSELDDDEAVELTAKLRRALGAEMQRVEALRHASTTGKVKL